MVVPTGKTEPEGGTQAIVEPGQLSETKAEYVTLAAHWPTVLSTVLLAGQVAEGGSLSFTVTVNWQVSCKPPASLAIQVTVVTPFGKAMPDGGLHSTTTPGQLSVALAV
jgi:hypothetical protein